MWRIHYYPRAAGYHRKVMSSNIKLAMGYLTTQCVQQEEAPFQLTKEANNLPPAVELLVVALSPMIYIQIRYPTSATTDDMSACYIKQPNSSADDFLAVVLTRAKQLKNAGKC